MSRLFFLTIFLSLALVSYSQRCIDVTHYRYEVSLNDSDDSIHCKAYISFIATGTSQSVVFDLAGIDKKGKGMLVTQASFPGKGNSAVNIIHENEKITIPATVPLKKGDTATVMIDYRGIPADGLIISKNKYGHRTFFADNWPDRGHNWLACIDDPADKATLEFIVRAPQHYRVVANGVLAEEIPLSGNMKLTRWKEDMPIPPKVMVIGVADFAVDLAGTVADSIPVSSWVYPEDREKGFYDYAQAVTILPFYINYIGPYGYKKLANVQSKTRFGGLENANTIFYFENSVTGTRISESLMAHEIAHQWFGNMATEKSFAHLWLSEGFATYMTILYMENRYGADTATKMLKEDREAVIAFVKESTKPVVDTVSSFMQLLNANSYQKGGWILHMLRRQLGDSVFHNSIRAYYAKYAGKNADTKDLQQVFEKISGRNLSIFFEQWLYKPGIPKLNIKWSYSENDKKLLVTISQLQKDPFLFPLDLRLEDSAGKQKMEKIQVSRSEETFTIPANQQIIHLLADPMASLLFQGTTSEIH